MTTSICQIMGIFLFSMFYRHSGSTANQSQTTVCYVVQLKKKLKAIVMGRKWKKVYTSTYIAFLFAPLELLADYREIAEKK